MRVILSAGKKVYFTLLASSFMFPISAFAQCVENKDCSALGYTETTNKENCLKCPFGEYWACPEEKCGTSYKYTCTGTNQKKPLTGACNGKYTFCNCAAGYEWNNGTCSKTLPKCQIGYIYYTDDTCSYNFDSSKTPKGVVAYTKPGGGGYAVTGYIGRSSVNSYVLTNNYYNNLPKLTKTEAENNFNSNFREIGIPGGVAKSLINNLTEIAHKLTRAGLTSFDGFEWQNFRTFSTNAAVSGAANVLWGYSIRMDYYAPESQLKFETSELQEIPIDLFDTGVYVWNYFEF